VSALADVRAVTYPLWCTLLVDADPVRTREVRAEALAEVLGTSPELALAHARSAHVALHVLGLLQNVHLRSREL